VSKKQYCTIRIKPELYEEIKNIIDKSEKYGSVSEFADEAARSYLKELVHATLNKQKKNNKGEKNGMER